MDFFFFIDCSALPLKKKKDLLFQFTSLGFSKKGMGWESKKATYQALFETYMEHELNFTRPKVGPTIYGIPTNAIKETAKQSI